MWHFQEKIRQRICLALRFCNASEHFIVGVCDLYIMSYSKASKSKVSTYGLMFNKELNKLQICQAHQKHDQMSDRWRYLFMAFLHIITFSKFTSHQVSPGRQSISLNLFWACSLRRSPEESEWQEMACCLCAVCVAKGRWVNAGDWLLIAVGNAHLFSLMRWSQSLEIFCSHKYCPPPTHQAG